MLSYNLIPLVELFSSRGVDLTSPAFGHSSCFCNQEFVESTEPAIEADEVRSHFLHIQHLTCWGRDKMAANVQTTFSTAYPWMKSVVFC